MVKVHPEYYFLWTDGQEEETNLEKHWGSCVDSINTVWCYNVVGLCVTINRNHYPFLAPQILDPGYHLPQSLGLVLPIQFNNVEAGQRAGPGPRQTRPVPLCLGAQILGASNNWIPHVCNVSVYIDIRAL